MAEKTKKSWTEAQTCAMDLRNKLLLVSAAAGSGKTSVLTERIIRTLTQPDHPADLSRMLIVTFTRAATAELKGRIAEALTKALAERPGDTHLSRQLFLLESAQISTIDSFFQQAVRANFAQLDLPAAFRLAEEAEADALCLDVMSDSIRAMYDRYGTDAESPSPLEKLRENRFAKIMDHLMSNRNDPKFDRKLLELRRKFNAYPEGIGRLHQYAQAYRSAAEGNLFDSVAGHALYRYMNDAMSEVLFDLEKAMSYLGVDPDAEIKYSGLISYDLDYCRELLDALAESSYERIRRALFGYSQEKFPGYRNKPLPILEYKQVRDHLKKLSADLRQDLFGFSEAEVSQQLSVAAEICDRLFELFEEFNNRVWEEKKQRGILEFDDVREQLYHLLVTSDGTVTPFAESLSKQYDAVYIDEYQDVDSLQDRIFALIGGNRRFMVGDIKQSIYGFRGSEPSIFTGYRNAMPQHDDPKAAESDAVCVFMSENFRCNRPVIEFANRVCAFLFSACEESVGYRPKDDLVFSKGRDPSLPEAPAVQAVVFESPAKKGTAPSEDEENDERASPREAMWVAAEISRLIREERLDNGVGIRPSDIAILVRNTRHGDRFAEELEALGIPVSAPGSQDILHAPLMTDTLNLLRAIDNPHKDLPLSEYLLSPNGGFTLEELTEIREAAPDHKTLYDAITVMANSPMEALSEKSAQWVAWLDAQRKVAAAQPVDRFLRLLYLDPRLSDYASTPELLTLYEQARSYQKNSWCGLFGFLAHIDHLTEGKSISAAGFQKEADAVSVMTIHHSKGLEYPVVFVCSCDKRPSNQSVKDNVIFHGRIGCTSKLFDPADGSNRSNLLREIAKLETRADEAEEAIRVLYVALTRARERLYITGTPTGKIDTAIEYAKRVKRGSRENILFHGNYLQWILAALFENAENTSEFPCIFRKILLSDSIESIPLKVADDLPEPTKKEDCPVQKSLERYCDILSKSTEFTYPLDAIRDFPTKLAASKLQPDLLDAAFLEEDEESLDRQIKLLSGPTASFDALLDQRKLPTASEIGTATHAFLQYCDPNRLTKTNLQQETDTLVALGFLSADSAKILNRRHLEAFQKSDLLQQILQAKKVYREQKFALTVPFSSLSAENRDDEVFHQQTVLVQGSIDLILETTDGRLLLFDYKTDHVTDDEAADFDLLKQHMTQKHGDQLDCYSTAVKRLFGKVPDGVYIYSVPLGSSIPIETDSEKYQ